jgi:uncharacterized protein (TIGR03118 family)
MDFRLMNRLLAVPTLAITLAVGIASGAGYFQTNLTSDIPGLANNLDPNLKNPWGISFSVTSPFWVSDQVTDVATLYNGLGAPVALVVSTPPPPGGGPTGPTGQVFVGGQGFTMTTGPQANFVFATLAGTIDAWNSGTSAVTQTSGLPGSVYTGLALAGNLLYAANTSANRIDVYNNSFAPTTVPGGFVNPSVPAGFTPYNIQNVGGQLYVEYAKQNAPGGLVGIFDTNGNFVRNIIDSHFNGPWGVTLAPATFGPFGNRLLVGNFGDGLINAFDASTGAFVGTIMDSVGKPIANSGLWALAFRAPNSGFDSNTLFFTAGINNELNGLFGEIQVVPEPATLSLIGLTLGALALTSRKLRH